MSIRVHTNQEAESDAGTDQRHKAAPICAFFQFDIVCRSRRQRFASADNGAGFVGDFAAADGRLKKRIRKPKRSVIRDHMKRVIQHKQRTFQQRSGVCGKAFQVILCKELRQQCFCAIFVLFYILHRFTSFSFVPKAQAAFSLLYCRTIFVSSQKDYTIHRNKGKAMKVRRK